MNRKIPLKKFDVNEDVFNKILTDYKDYLKLVPTIDPYRCGYSGTDMNINKKYFVYDGKEYLIMHEYQLSAVLDNFSLTEFNYDDIVACDNCWKQCVIRKVVQVADVEAGVTGLAAWNYMKKVLSKYYSPEKFEERLNMFEAEYDQSNIQMHYLIKEQDKILKFDNCYKYDINSAHGSALIEIFPKAKDAIVYMYEQRKNNKNYKDFMNFFVGMLCRKKHRKTYNWIVQRTNRLMNELIESIYDINKSDILYANTDGFIIQNPIKIIDSNKNIGMFKLEYSGEVRFYKDKNYYIYEIDADDERKRLCGNLPIALRSEVHLNKNEVVHFDKYQEYLIDGSYIWKTKNIIKEVK